MQLKPCRGRDLLLATASGIVVDDLAAATEFCVQLGLELQGEGPVEGALWTVVGLGIIIELAERID